MNKYIRLKNKIESRLGYFEDALSKWTKSPKYDMFLMRFLEFERTSNQYIQILDKYIKTTSYRRYDSKYLKIIGKTKNWPDRKTHLFSAIGIDIRNKQYHAKAWTEKDTVLKGMEQSAKEQAVAGHRFQLQTWIAQAHKEGKYIFFSSLTVSQENFNKVFKRGGKAWSLHIQALQIDQAEKAGFIGTKKEKEQKGRGLMDYFGVTEEGGETGRLHIHGIYACTYLPSGAVDPNRGKFKPIENNIKGMHRFWRHGHTVFAAIRFSGRDVFGQLGWRWPLDPKTGEPLESSNPGRVAGYLTKYVTKTQLRETVKTEEVLQWNTKKTRNLGMKEIHKYFRKISTDGLLNLLSLNTSVECVKIYGNTMPPRLLRNTILSHLKERIETPGKINKMMKEKNIAFQQLAKCTREKKHASSSQSIGNLTAQLYAKTGTFDALPLYLKLKEDLERLYPLPSSIPRVHGGQVANTRF